MPLPRTRTTNTIPSLASTTTFTALITLLISFPTFARASVCDTKFIAGLQKINFTHQHCRLSAALDVRFAWNLDTASKSQQKLEIAFGSRLHHDSGWLAWGVNPDKPRMVGTIALIGIKQPTDSNESLECHTYNITNDIKRKCPLLPSDQVGLKFENYRFALLPGTDYYLIRATVYLMPRNVYNVSRTHVVWQRGSLAIDGQPLAHERTLKHLDTAHTINLVDNKILGYRHRQINRVRRAHGAFNIIGWGIMLPSGVIIVRYFREPPLKWESSVYVHKVIQTVGYFTGAAGFILGVWLGNHSSEYSFPVHRIVADFIIAFATLQILALKLKPKKERDDELRKYWNIYHHVLGYSLLALISLNIFLGIRILGPSFPLEPTYVAVLATFGLVALALECYIWFRFVKNKRNNNKQEESSEHLQPSPGASQSSKPTEIN